MLGVEPQDAAADGMESAAPNQPRYDAAVSRLAAIRHDLGNDALRALDHFLRSAARKGQHENARRISAVHNQVSRAMRQRTGLTGSGPGQNEQWTGADAFLRDYRAECGGAALPWVQRVERVWLNFHHNFRYCTYIQISKQQPVGPLQHYAFTVRRARSQITHLPDFKR